MKKDAVIDFETMGTAENAVLLSVGVIAVDPDFINVEDWQETFDTLIANGLYIKIRAENQVTQYGRTITKDTMQWWKSQGAEAQHVIQPSEADVDISEVPGMINYYLKEHGFNGHLWTRGMIDGRWLESACNDVGVKVTAAPWWTHRDVRTAIDILCGTEKGYLPKDLQFHPDGFIKHNALHDCANDTIQLAIAHSI